MMRILRPRSPRLAHDIPRLEDMPITLPDENQTFGEDLIEDVQSANQTFVSASLVGDEAHRQDTITNSTRTIHHVNTYRRGLQEDASGSDPSSDATRPSSHHRRLQTPPSSQQPAPSGRTSAAEITQPTLPRPPTLQFGAMELHPMLQESVFAEYRLERQRQQHQLQGSSLTELQCQPIVQEAVMAEYQVEHQQRQQQQHQGQPPTTSTSEQQQQTQTQTLRPSNKRRNRLGKWFAGGGRKQQLGRLQEEPATPTTGADNNEADTTDNGTTSSNTADHAWNALEMHPRLQQAILDLYWNNRECDTVRQAATRGLPTSSDNLEDLDIPKIALLVEQQHHMLRSLEEKKTGGSNAIKSSSDKEHRLEDPNKAVLPLVPNAASVDRQLIQPRDSHGTLQSPTSRLDIFKHVTIGNEKVAVGRALDGSCSTLQADSLTQTGDKLYDGDSSLPMQEVNHPALYNPHSRTISEVTLPHSIMPSRNKKTNNRIGTATELVSPPATTPRGTTHISEKGCMGSWEELKAPDVNMRAAGKTADEVSLTFPEATVPREHLASPTMSSSHRSTGGGIRSTFLCQCCFVEKEANRDRPVSCDNIAGPHLFCEHCIKRYIWSTKEATGPMPPAAVAGIVTVPCFCENREPCSGVIHIQLLRLLGQEGYRQWLQAPAPSSPVSREGSQKATKDTMIRIQSAMKDALSKTRVRSCPQCKQAFIKNDYGCNKMTCPRCKTTSCYLCRERIPETGYTHFCNSTNPTVEEQAKCPLWTDEKSDQRREKEEMRQVLLDLADQVFEECVQHSSSESGSDLPLKNLSQSSLDASVADLVNTLPTEPSSL